MNTEEEKRHESHLLAGSTQGAISSSEVSTKAGNLSWSTIVEQLLAAEPGLRLGKFQLTGVSGSVLYDSLDSSLIAFTQFDASGNPGNCVFLEESYFTLDGQEESWIHVFSAPWQDLSLVKLLEIAKVMPLTDFGFGCVKGEMGSFVISTPKRLATPEFVARLVIEIFNDISRLQGSTLDGAPGGAAAMKTPALNLDEMQSGLRNNGYPEIYLKLTQSALTLTHPVDGLTLLSYVFENEAGGQVEVFSKHVNNLTMNEAFTSLGFGVAPDYGPGPSLGVRVALAPRSHAVEDLLSVAAICREAALGISHFMV